MGKDKTQVNMVSKQASSRVAGKSYRSFRRISYPIFFFLFFLRRGEGEMFSCHSFMLKAKYHVIKILENNQHFEGTKMINL
uniref:Uncharacterized protein n=1 Tax=Nelumbo nucifera TaxID=4432 RepID=A0A822YWZ3_NELNU|nr:TPA_asm: hypothetical protein HUJ06_007698 [Nelumbo nucifera]